MLTLGTLASQVQELDDEFPEDSSWVSLERQVSVSPSPRRLLRQLSMEAPKEAADGKEKQKEAGDEKDKGAPPMLRPGMSRVVDA